MNFVIRIKNGQPVDHPITIENFRQAFPRLDENNLPSEFAKFNLRGAPVPGPYEIVESQEFTYQLVDGVWSDVWTSKQMTEQEKSEKIARVHAAWTELNEANNNNWSAWTFDESKCAYVSPIPRPKGVEVFWQGTTNTWVVSPTRPNDGKAYKLDFALGTWVEVTP
jgi:hypothetical protein